MTGKQAAEAITRSGAAVVLGIVTLVGAGVATWTNSLWGTLDARLEAQEERLAERCDERIQEIANACILDLDVVQTTASAHIEDMKELCGIAELLQQVLDAPPAPPP